MTQATTLHFYYYFFYYTSTSSTRTSSSTTYASTYTTTTTSSTALLLLPLLPHKQRVTQAVVSNVQEGSADCLKTQNLLVIRFIPQYISSNEEVTITSAAMMVLTRAMVMTRVQHWQ